MVVAEGSKWWIQYLHVSKMAHGKLRKDPAVGVKWSSWMPLKVKCFVWRLSRQIIPIATKLAARGVPFESLVCHACNQENECINHMFIECLYVKSLWRLTSNWTGINLVSVASIYALLKQEDLMKKKIIPLYVQPYGVYGKIRMTKFSNPKRLGSNDCSKIFGL
ncbi:putative reverse transcriptase zinc-binding domain-containing protein [Helianthus anomalus]